MNEEFLLNIRFVCPFICALYNSFTYSTNIMNFIYVVHIYYRINCRGNDLYGAIRVHLQGQQKFFDTLKRLGRKFLKRASTYCMKCNEINVCHLDIQKYVSYEKSFKYYILFVYRFTQKFSYTLRCTGGKF